MESDRSDVCGPLIQLLVAKRTTPAVQIFTREFQSVQDGAMNGRDFPKRAAEPGFWTSFLRHSQWPPSKNGSKLDYLRIQSHVAQDIGCRRGGP
jgi:hypothetical protein